MSKFCLTHLCQICTPVVKVTIVFRRCICFVDLQIMPLNLESFWEEILPNVDQKMFLNI